MTEVQSDPEDGPPARSHTPGTRRGRHGRGVAALRSFLPLRPSKSLGRLDGIKEVYFIFIYCVCEYCRPISIHIGSNKKNQSEKIVFGYLTFYYIVS